MVSFPDPNLGDLEIQRYSDDHISDEYENMSLTLEGSLGELEAVYAGAYTDRETNQIVDYTDYLFVGQYLPYYICDYYVTYTTYAPGVQQEVVELLIYLLIQQQILKLKVTSLELMHL